MKFFSLLNGSCMFLSKTFIPFLMILSCTRLDPGGFSVMNGQFRQSIIESGELHAVNSSTMSMPRINPIYGYNFKIISLAEHGKKVNKGEIVVKVDQSSVQKYIIERNESLENEIASANKLRVQNHNNLQELKAQLENEQAAFNIKKLERDKSAFESAGIRKVIQLEYRMAEIRLAKIKRNLELRPVLDSLDYRIQRIKVRQKENDLRAAKDALNLLNIRSPGEGIFVVEVNFRTGQTIRVGDDVYIGNPVAKIPDIRTMKVNGFIQENDIKKISTGQEVIIRLDAMPSVQFHGKVNKISKVCIPMEKKKVFLTEVLIEENDARLKPGMTVSCEYITYDKDGETFVPTRCILEESKHKYLFVRKAGKIKKTEIQIGLSNNTYTIVLGDISAGQKLVLPEDVLTK